jgi:uncharacterized membrane protein YdbT with pleckstrin-like domain
MPEFTIRPTLKLIKAGYAAVGLLILAAFVVYFRWDTGQSPWLPTLSALLLIWPMSRHARRRFTRMVLTEDKLRYEKGFLTKSTRTVPFSKIQDVRLDQTLAQRLLGVGDISIETAGETGRLTIADIDRPQQVADRIMEASDRSSNSRI